MIKFISHILVFCLFPWPVWAAGNTGEPKQKSRYLLTEDDVAKLNQLARDDDEASQKTPPEEKIVIVTPDTLAASKKNAVTDRAVVNMTTREGYQRGPAVLQARTCQTNCGLVSKLAKNESTASKPKQPERKVPTGWTLVKEQPGVKYFSVDDTAEPVKRGQNKKNKKLTGEEKFSKNSDHAENWLLRTLPRHIGQDIKEAFWNPWHALVIAAGSGLAVGVHEKDPEIINSLKGNPRLGKKFNDVVEWGFHPFVMGGATLLAFGGAKIAHDEKAIEFTSAMLEGFILTEAMTVGLQFATQRGRPDGSGNTAFPSGHTSGAFALATIATSYYGPWVGVPSYALASVIGFSRVDSLKHAASDVIAGALLGTIVGLGTAKFHKKEFSKDYVILPTISSNSAGISVFKQF